MEARFARDRSARGRDPHSWQTWDRYRTVHEVRLRNHPFVDWSKEQPLGFEEQGESIWLLGRIYCLHDVIIDVEKELETQTSGRLLQVRGLKYRYVAWVRDHHSILRYHNTHLHDDDYHHRVFDWRTGEEILYETLERHQFPTFSEVLDEVQAAYLAFE